MNLKLSFIFADDMPKILQKALNRIKNRERVAKLI